MTIDFEDALFSYLLGYAGLTTLVSTRIYPVSKTFGHGLPCMVISRIDTPHEGTMDSSGDTGDLVNPRFQFDIYAVTLKETYGIARQLKKALNGKRGNIGTAPASLSISGRVLDERDVEKMGDVELNGRQLDFELWYEET